jgi:hypothetical protein
MPGRDAYLDGLLGGAIVNTGNAAPVAAPMVQDLLDHARLHAEIGHARSDRSPKDRAA